MEITERVHAIVACYCDVLGKLGHVHGVIPVFAHFLFKKNWTGSSNFSLFSYAKMSDLSLLLTVE